MRRLPSPALVVSCLALAVSLGGVSYAAVKLPKNSVGEAQIKAGAVRSSEIKDNTVVGRDIKESSLATVPTAASAANADKLDGLDWAVLGSSKRYAGIDFHPRDSALQMGYAGTGGIFQSAPANSNEYFTTRLDLPQGAKVTQITFFMAGADMSDFSLAFTKYGDSFGDLEFTQTNLLVGSVVVMPVDPIVTIDNSTNVYELLIKFGNASATKILLGAKVDYTLG